MTINNTSELYNQFFQIVELGDEVGARNFLITNIKEFPQDAQDVIVTAFLEEALAKQGAEDLAMAEFRKQGMESIATLNQIKAELEKKLKLISIKESL